eukprot:5560300-Ditylum_brightwellii.AAC.1
MLSDIISQSSATNEGENEKEEVLLSTDIQSDSNDELETDEKNDADQNSKKSEEHDDSDDDFLSQAPVTHEE